MIDSFQAEQTLRFELDSGERLLWAGQPAQGLRLQTADLFLVPFSLLWTGFVIFWEFMAISSRAPMFFRLWGLPFLAVGLYLTAGRFFADARRRSATCYGLTDRRILIRTGSSTPTLKSLPLAGLQDITLQEGPDGRGTIIFGPFPSPYAVLGASGWPGRGRFQLPLFDSIPDVKRVYQELREAQAAARDAAA
jgi:hypothetical protein